MKASLYRGFSLRAFIFLFAVPLVSYGVELQPMSERESPTSETIRSWIRDWEDAQFSVRRNATQNLESAGIEAFDELVEAALGNNAETTDRVLAILEKGARQPDSSIKEAALQSLQEIANSGNASVARAADELLRQYNYEARRMLQRNAAAVPVGFNRGNVRVINPPHAFGPLGARRIEIAKGDERTTIQTDAAGRIHMEMREKKDGKIVTRQLDAADEAELKAKHPEAYQTYAKVAPMWQRNRTPPAPQPAQLARQRATLINLMEQMNASTARLQDELARTTDQTRAESLRMSLQRLELQKRQIAEMMFRIR